MVLFHSLSYYVGNMIERNILEMSEKQRLNEILTNDKLLLGILKFSSKINLKSLQEGTLYLNNFQFFRDVERKEKRKGQGDAFDVTLQMSDVQFTFKHPETSEVFFRAHAENAHLENKEDYQRHLFCMTGITADLLEIIQVKENIATTRLKLPNKLKEEAIESFGDYVMLIDAGLFIERVEEICEKNEFTLIRRKVEYRDLSINHSDRIKAFSTGGVEFYFQKDECFAYQNEYRLLFPDLVSDGPEIIDIGSIKEFTTIIPTKDFFEHELRIEFNLTNKPNES